MPEPYKHQKEFLESEHKKFLLCWDMGTGKTRTSIEWAKILGGTTLIVVPKGLVDNWIRECKRWDFADYNIITKENFKKKFSTLLPYKNLIIDEAHYFAGQSQMNKTMQFYVDARPETNILCLTGTPYLRNAWNVYRLGHILGKKNEWKWNHFNYTFFTLVRMGYRYIPVQKQDEASKRLLAQYVNQIGSTKHLSECADVPESQEYPEYVEKTDDQEEGIRDLVDFEPIVRYTKEQQIMGGYLKGDDYTADQRYASRKRDRLMELIGQNEKIMVVCRYLHELEELERDITKIHRTVFVLRGDVKNRDEVVQKARKAEECVLLVGAQISEGWEIPEIETMIFYSHSFSLKDYVQMKGRIQRINDLRPRCYVHLLVKDSVDEGVHRALMNKQDFLVHIYAEKKRSQSNNQT